MRRSNIPTELHTERLLLRAPTMMDCDAVFEIFSDPATSLHNPAGPLRDREAAADLVWRWHMHWAQHGFGLWMMAHKHAPEQVIGVGGLSWRDYGCERRLNLGCRLRPGCWGQGIATELGRHALEVARCRLGVQTIHALIRPDNLAAQRLLARLGLQVVGEWRDFPWSASNMAYCRALDDSLVRETTRAVRRVEATTPTFARPAQATGMCRLLAEPA